MGDGFVLGASRLFLLGGSILSLSLWLLDVGGSRAQELFSVAGVRCTVSAGAGKIGSSGFCGHDDIRGSCMRRRRAAEAIA